MSSRDVADALGRVLGAALLLLGLSVAGPCSTRARPGTAGLRLLLEKGPVLLREACEPKPVGLLKPPSDPAAAPVLLPEALMLLPVLLLLVVLAGPVKLALVGLSTRKVLLPGACAGLLAPSRLAARLLRGAEDERNPGLRLKVLLLVEPAASKGVVVTLTLMVKPLVLPLAS